MEMIKQLTGALVLLSLATPSLARSVRPIRDYHSPGGTVQTTCYKTIYTETYVPGTASNPGYVQRGTKRIAVPCESVDPPWSRPAPTPAPVDDNSCIEGAVLGGIAGGALGAGLSRDEGNLIGIPLGIVGGALVGCQVDGG